MVAVRIRRARTRYDPQEVHCFISDGAREMAEALQLSKVRFSELDTLVAYKYLEL